MVNLYEEKSAGFSSKNTSFYPAIFLGITDFYGQSRWIKRIKYSTMAQFLVGTIYCPCNALAKYILQQVHH